jgi:hypothetical protein
MVDIRDTTAKESEHDEERKQVCLIVIKNGVSIARE